MEDGGRGHQLQFVDIRANATRNQAVVLRGLDQGDCINPSPAGACHIAHFLEWQGLP
jgi:hypothetical protein